MKIVEYDVKERQEDVAENKRFNDTKFGGWKAINIGTGNVVVDGVTLEPGEGLEHDMHPSEHWTQPIDIVIAQPGGIVRLLRKICTPRVVNIKE